MPVATAKAQKNWPVRATTKPVSAGAATPARLPKPFCTAVHLPAAGGPASVWISAQWLELHIPKKMHARNSRAMDRFLLSTIATGRMTVDNVRPPTVHVLRTRVGVAPAAIQWSESHPHSTEESPIDRNASALMLAIWSLEKLRSFTI